MATLLHPSAAAMRGIRPKRKPWLDLLLVGLLLFAFLVGIRGVSEALRGLGHEYVQGFFGVIRNPFAGLAVGVLATSVMQSSSASTSMVVAMVSAPGNPLPIDSAIPMVLGANIGTTVTSTLVALGYARRKNEFGRAFSAAVSHDLFNLLAVGILLPLELATGLLEKTSGLVAQAVGGVATQSRLPNPVGALLEVCVESLDGLVGALVRGSTLRHWLLAALCTVVVLGCLGLLVRVLRRVTGGQLQVYLTRSLDSHPLVTLLVGVIVTVMVQSSSITTSVLVPLAAAGMISLKQVLPITLGANLGTTVTAMIAAVAAPAQTATFAIQIAAVHVLFNMAGIVLVYPTPLRGLLLRMTRALTAPASRLRKVAFLYVALVFYVLPAAVILVYRSW